MYDDDIFSIKKSLEELENYPTKKFQKRVMDGDAFFVWFL